MMMEMNRMMNVSDYFFRKKTHSTFSCLANFKRQKVQDESTDDDDDDDDEDDDED